MTFYPKGCCGLWREGLERLAIVYDYLVGGESATTSVGVALFAIELGCDPFLEQDLSLVQEGTTEEVL